MTKLLGRFLIWEETIKPNYHFKLAQLKSVFLYLYHATNLVAAFIVLFSTSIGGLFFSCLLKNKYYFYLLLSFTFGMGLSACLMVLIYQKSSPIKWLLKGYRWVKAEYRFSIVDDSKCSQSQEISILLEAIRDGVDHFENRYIWSGEGIEGEPEVISSGHILMGHPIQHELWKTYYVHLGHTLAKGERTEIKLKQLFIDKNNKFEPFLAKAIIEPLDFLSLCVIFPQGILPKEITLSERNGIFPFSSSVEAKCGWFNTEKREILWEIRSPTIGHFFEIRWSW